MIVSSNRIQSWRLTRAWSQAELAERAGISRAAVSAIEGERLSPSVATALALAEVFECSVEELVSPLDASAIRGFEHSSACCGAAATAG
jgi:DNA-binding XRE family transcriptional regulator